MSKPVISVEHLSKAYRIGLKEEIPDTLMGALTSWLQAPLRNWRRLRRLDASATLRYGPASGGRQPPDTAAHPAEPAERPTLSVQRPTSNGHGDPLPLPPGEGRGEGPSANSQPLTTHHSPLTTHQADILWALRDVSFEVAEGEVVGIIGRNGAGKSTLLKILSRITDPTSGRAVIRGRVSSLLEVGTGFHPELTGRENIYMNGTVLGMTKREIDRKFDEIVDFSGVERFLDTPTKRYSSGMQVRLAFSVAAHLEPEILIIDEVLAVGDAEFQKKCLGKMQDVARGGRTVLFVSHNMAAVQILCPTGVILEQGCVTEAGPVEKIVNRYLAQMSGTVATSRDLRHAQPRSGDGRIRIEWVQLQDNNHDTLRAVMVGQPASIVVGAHVIRYTPAFHVVCTIYDAVGNALTTFDSRDAVEFPGNVGRRAVARCRIDRVPFAPGTYRLNLAVVDQTNVLQDRIEGALSFDVERGDFFGNGKLPSHSYSRFYVTHSWLSVTDELCESS